MKNFNVYDPLKRGQGLVLDGQTLAHIEVSDRLMKFTWKLMFSVIFYLGLDEQ